MTCRSCQISWALGVVLMVMGEREAGQERLKRIAQSSEPRALRAYVLLANQASVDGRFDEAIDYYVEGSDRFPDRFSMRFNLGMTLIGQERFEEAVPVLEAALMLKPNAKSAWNNLGKSFVQLDRPRDAEACFLRTIALDERNLHAKWYLARILAERRAVALCDEDDRTGRLRQTVRRRLAVDRANEEHVDHSPVASKQSGALRRLDDLVDVDLAVTRRARAVRDRLEEVEVDAGSRVDAVDHPLDDTDLRGSSAIVITDEDRLHDDDARHVVGGHEHRREERHESTRDRRPSRSSRPSRGR